MRLSRGGVPVGRCVMPHIRQVAAADERFVAGSGNLASPKRIVVTQFSYHVYETLFALDAECIPFPDC